MCSQRSPDCFPRSLALIVVLVGLVVPHSARAHRPYDVAEAAVAEESTLESELGVRYRARGNAYGNVLPFGLTMGIDERTEIAIAGRVDPATRDGRERKVKDFVFAAKHLLRAGSLQDAAGVSIAGECALPLAAFRGGDAGGAACALIASHRLDAADFHVNAALSRGSDDRLIRHFGIALEGPAAWTVRPLAELSSECIPGQARSYARLLGFHWQPVAGWSFGLALRHARTDGVRTGELRFGLQWSTRYRSGDISQGKARQ